jgi:3-deoxy-manno-octulosonate cytidylyltransferase (CMP-KDO synthetase)
MRIALIIPARLASTRFPAKPLAPITGPDGVARPAIHYTWAAAQVAAAALPGTVDCVVATDDERIAEHCRAKGMAVVMTPEHCGNGTERCAAAMSGLTTPPDIVVNLQGDAPLTPAAMVSAVVALLAARDDLVMTTAVVPTTPSVLAHLQADAAAGRVGGTTAVCARDGRALYFSKSIIPHVGPGTTPMQPVLLHVGLYAYRPAALAAYVAAGPAPLELQEGLEQLRFLDAGLPVGVAQCAAPAWDMIELNNPTDVPLIEAALARRAAVEPR